MSLPRDFKGIWIPKELWLDHRLTYFEKMMIAEIDSLDGPEHCFADNKHFEQMFNAKERTVSEAITKLKRLGLAEQIKFDGRKRTLKSNLKNYYTLFYGSESQKEDDKHYFTGLTSGNPLPDSIDKTIEPEIPIEIPDLKKDVFHTSKKRQKKEPEPTKEREPGIFTTDYEHQKLVERIGTEKEVRELYVEISRWKKKEGIDRGDDYRTAIKWHRPKQKKEPLAKKDSPKIHDDPILTWKFVKELERTDPLAAKHELNKMDELEKERYGKWKSGTLY